MFSDLISLFSGNRELSVILDGNSSHEYPVDAGGPEDLTLGSTLSFVYITGLPDNVLCTTAIYPHKITYYSKHDLS